MTSEDSPDATPVRYGLIVGGNPVRLWGMSAGERLRRSLKVAGLTETESAATPPGDVVIVHDGWVFDAVLIADLARRRGALLLDPATGTAVAANVDPASASIVAAQLGNAAWVPPSSLVRLLPEELSGAYNHRLRKREAPFLLPLTQASLDAIERRTFGASYKGVTDVVTKYFWPRPARTVTRICAELKMSPNQVTTIGFVLTLLSFWLFWNGHYVTGLVSGWIMTFLDTVDGKLARVTLTSSKFGNAFDHGIDLVHPPFWWWAWVVGLAAYGTPLVPEQSRWVLIVILGGYVVQRCIEGIFNLNFNMHVHVWRRFDSIFRLWTARRNPNLLILTPAALLGRPDLGIVLVAWWTAISLVVHAVQLVQAFVARRHGPLESWLSR